jgi:hypothetical protein
MIGMDSLAGVQRNDIRGERLEASTGSFLRQRLTSAPDFCTDKPQASDAKLATDAGKLRQMEFRLI